MAPCWPLSLARVPSSPWKEKSLPSLHPHSEMALEFCNKSAVTHIGPR